MRRSSLKAGIVAPSVMLRKLAAYHRQNQLDLALQELGRIERTLFMLDWLESPELRRRMPGSTRASSVISSRRSSAPSNKAGLQTRPDCRPQCRGAAVSCLRPQRRHRHDRVLELHLHRRRHRPSPRDWTIGARCVAAAIGRLIAPELRPPVRLYDMDRHCRTVKDKWIGFAGGLKE
jgi:hypothetical protein